MTWIKVDSPEPPLHECLPPLGWEEKPVGSVWKCPDCRMRWKVTMVPDHTFYDPAVDWRNEKLLESRGRLPVAWRWRWSMPSLPKYVWPDEKR